MQIIDRRQALSIPPLLRLGFRPFFLLGALFAALAVPLWLIALEGHAGWQPSGGWLAWHRHELVFGFGLAIIAGFLLTAAQNWTGIPGPSGRPLGVLVALWLVGRVAWLGGLPGGWLLAIELLFPLGVCLALGRMLWKARQRRNYPVLVIVTLLGLADALSVCGLIRADEALQRQGVLAALWLIAALLGLIGGRVIPFFTQRGVGRIEAIPPVVWLDFALLGGGVLVAVLHAVGVATLPVPAIGALFVLLAVGHGVRLVRWQDRRLWRVPLLWSLHIGYAWLILACLGMAGWHFGLIHNGSAALHALSVGAMGGLILAMIARVSLGHTGRPLEPSKWMILAFALLNLGGLARVFGVGFWPHGALCVAGACWVAAFALFVICYAPILGRPRPDGHPG